MYRRRPRSRRAALLVICAILWCIYYNFALSYANLSQAVGLAVRKPLPDVDKINGFK